MLTRVRNHLRHNFVAYLALWAALSGTAYAAGVISGQKIKNRSIPGQKIKRDALGGAEIRESKLGPVPSAARAGIDRLNYKSKEVAIQTGDIVKGNVACDSGLHAVGGGIKLGSTADQTLLDSYPVGSDAWEGNVVNGITSAPGSFTVYVICAPAASVG